MRHRIALTAALLVLLGGCGSDPDPVAEDPAPKPDRPSQTQEPRTPSPTLSAVPAEPPDSGPTTVPAYFVGSTPQGLRLYREFRKVSGDALIAAAQLVTAGEAHDGDYRTLFPGGELKSVEHSSGAGAFVVELADDSWQSRPAGMSRREAALAVQQLVYTLQGVGQARDPLVVQLDGAPTTLFGIDTADGVRNAAPLKTLALVNVTSPEEGATVSGSFTAAGVASSFEANVPWEIRDGDRVVASGFATAEGWMDKLYPWQVKVDVSELAPGSYTFAAMTDDPSGGAEGGGPTVDTKSITVR